MFKKYIDIFIAILLTALFVFFITMSAVLGTIITPLITIMLIAGIMYFAITEDEN